MKIHLLVLFGLLFFSVSAQNLVQVKGKISDQNGALPGTSVVIQNAKIGVSSDENGNYSISFPYKNNEKIYIVFSFIGKKTKIVEYKNQLTIDVFLEDELQVLETVVITAKSNINAISFREKVGSVSNVKAEKIKDIPSPNIALSLQGKVQGLQIINTGELGAAPKIRIRGTSSLRKGNKANEPLYILDGKIISPETFSYLNPEDIKEIKVLKDAVASALYGIKAANGVIEIYSKKGGNKSFSVHTQSGFSFPNPLKVKLMNTSEKLQLEELLESENTPGYLYSKKYIDRKYYGSPLYSQKLSEANAKIDSLKKIDTNWHKILSSIETYSKYDLNFRNSSENNSYFLSLGYASQSGQMKGNTLSRISTQMGIDQHLWENAIASLSVSGSFSSVKTPNGADFSVEQLIYDLNPYESKNSKSFYSYPRRNWENIFNQFQKETKNKSFGISSSLNWKITNDLNLDAVFGVDYSINESTEKTPETAFSQTKGGIPAYARGHLSQSKGSLTNISANLRLNYEKNFENHQLTLGANADNYTAISEGMSLSGYGVFANMTTASAIDNTLQGSLAPKVYGQKITERNLGFGALLGYTYDDIYNLFSTYKLDASSVLPKEKRWNTAWAVGVSWNVKNYKFLSEIDWLKGLDFRASFGNTANAQGISPSLITAVFQYKGESYMGVRELEIMNLPNPELRAEQNEIFDIGFSSSIKNTSFNVNFYKRKTIDALLSIPIASSSGFSVQLQNIGSLENKGVEVGVNQTITSGKFHWVRCGISVSYNQNVVLDLYGRDRIYTGDEEDAMPDYQVGKSVDGLYGLHSVGINPLTGLPEFINANNEQVTAYTAMKNEDFVYLGEQTPPYNGNFSLNANYKNIFLDFDLYFSLGGVKPYANTYIRDSYNAHKNADKNQIEKMWWKVGDMGKIYPTPFHSSSVDANLLRPNTKTIGKADFMRISNISVRYELSQRVLQHYISGLKRASVGVNCANIATFSAYKESDPESGNIVNPVAPTATININLSF